VHIPAYGIGEKLCQQALEKRHFVAFGTGFWAVESGNKSPFYPLFSMGLWFFSCGGIPIAWT